MGLNQVCDKVDENASENPNFDFMEIFPDSPQEGIKKEVGFIQIHFEIRLVVP